MTQPLTLEDLRQKVGRPWFSLEYVIECGMVRKYTEAVGDDNPRWRGGNAEMPPAMLSALGFEYVVSALLNLRSAVLHGSSDLDVYMPVRIGDVVTVTGTVVSLRERHLPAGGAAFITLRQDYTNQRGEMLASCKQLAIVRSGDICD